MKYQFILPWIMITLSFFAACIYAWHGDWRRATYWLAAAVLNVSVTI